MPQKKEEFFGIFKQFGIDLLERAKTIYAEKLRRQVLDIQKFRDTLNFILNNLSTGKMRNYCKREICDCEFKIYSNNCLWGDSKVYINDKKSEDEIKIRERTRLIIDPGVSKNQVCNVLKSGQL